MVLKEDKEFAGNGNQKGSFREEKSVISGTMRMSVQNRHQKPFDPLSQEIEEVEVRQRKYEPQEPDSIWAVRSTAVQRLLESQITL